MKNSELLEAISAHQMDDIGSERRDAAPPIQTHASPLEVIRAVDLFAARLAAAEQKPLERTAHGFEPAIRARRSLSVRLPLDAASPVRLATIATAAEQWIEIERLDVERTPASNASGALAYRNVSTDGGID